MKRALAFAPALAWALVILTLGSLPSFAPPSDLPIDKLGHFGVFAVLGGLLAAGLHFARARAGLVLALCAGLAVGALDELHQRRVPGRSSEAADFAADAAGCALGLWLTRRALAQRRARNPDGAARAASNTIQEHRA